MAYQSQQTPGKPRQSGIPAPGARSGIPTPGSTRPRSLTASSSSGGAPPALPTPSTNGDMARALSEAIKANDPRQHNKTSVTDSPTSTTSSSYAPRKSAGGWLQTPSSSQRPGSAASSVASAKSTSPRTSDAGGTRMMQPTTPTSSTGARYAPRQSTTTPTYKTPSSSYAPRASTASSRPASRLSEAAGRAPSRAGRGFEVGDMVRIESIGMEGTLRYMGEIEGKPGAWAGVELSGGFAGRGKNDGSVNGVAYFVCPPKCGVFVATNKLSPPTTGAVRPSSVASSRGGRVTPAMSAGRVTPSPVPPRTPQFRTPAAPRQSMTSRAGVTPKAADSNKYTAGSRASKYAGMTARQLRGDENRATSPTGTPKATITRPSFGGIKVPGMTTATTPKPATRRTDMPPPASPAFSGRSVLNHGDVKPGTPTLSQTSTETAVDDSPETAALAAANKALQEKIAALTAGMASARAPTPRAPTPARAQTPLPDPRIEKLEVENAKLSAELTALKGAADASKTRLAELESSLKTAERSLTERTAKVEALERAATSAQADVDKARAEGESKARDLQGRLEHQEALVTSLRAAVETTEGRKGESDALLEAKQTEITLLEARLEKSLREWDEERKELNLQVDELRLAGQETIALYEERLSASEQQKYDLEDMLEAVTAKLKEAEAAQPVRPPSPTTRSTAAEIDNETLREQAVHLQQKIAALEDQLEESQAAFEREEAAMRTRVAKYKEADERLKRDGDAIKAERDQARRDCEAARQRVAELEEALRENGVALEDARADVEGLRAELANLASSNQEGGETLPTRLDEARKAERARVQEELASLKETLEATKASKRELQEHADAVKAELDSALRERDALKSSESANIDPKTIEELRASLEERAAELEQLRKSQNRDRPVSTPASPLDGNFLLPEGALTPRSSSKHDREEIAGLKHIVQDLTKETVSLQSQNRLLEKENKMLLSETEELRDAIKQLETTVEESILREERQLNGELQALDAVTAASADLPTDVAELQQALQELRIKFDTEVDALKKKLAAQEQKSARTIHDLNKELSELESLVEAKIYREDDLEREIERLKAKLERGGHKSSSSKASVAPDVAPISTSSAPASASSEAVCEICEQPGHDIFTCHLLKDDPAPSLSQPPSARSSGEGDPSALWCDDCESHGHVAADCPHSLDVF